MKKILSVLAIMLAVVLGSAMFTSCSSSDDDNSSFITNASFDVDKLYGDWDCDGYGGASAGGYVWISELSGTSLYFGSNGKMTTRGLFGNYTNVSYTISGDVINVTPPSGADGYIRIRVISLKDSYAEFKLELSTGTSGYFSFKK